MSGFCVLCWFLFMAGAFHWGWLQLQLSSWFWGRSAWPPKSHTNILSLLYSKLVSAEMLKNGNMQCQKDQLLSRNYTKEELNLTSSQSNKRKGKVSESFWNYGILIYHWRLPSVGTVRTNLFVTHRHFHFLIGRIRSNDLKGQIKNIILQNISFFSHAFGPGQFTAFHTSIWSQKI